jgi:predicted nucleic acid-binding protein
MSWLLGEPAQDVVLAHLAGATRVVSSSLTTVECSRAILRGRAVGMLSETASLALLRLLDESRSTWDLLELSEAVLRRAGESFPDEPIRTLDALHVATAIRFRESFPSLAVLSLDDRVRRNALSLGMKVLPESLPQSS